jgi:GR25 family glycosyltransferase involved in LPS biosynthesis
MNTDTYTWNRLAARLKNIGGDELTAASAIVLITLENFDAPFQPEIEHGLFIEIWGNISRALDVEDFNISHIDDVRSLEFEMAGYVLSYRLAKGWLVRSPDAPIQFPTIDQLITDRGVIIIPDKIDRVF